MDNNTTTDTNKFEYLTKSKSNHVYIDMATRSTNTLVITKWEKTIKGFILKDITHYER